MLTQSPASPAPSATGRHFILIDGDGDFSQSISTALHVAGCAVTIVGLSRPPQLTDQAMRWIEIDLLTEHLVLPDGEVVILTGCSDREPRWTWTLPLQIALTTARILPALRDHTVTLLSSAAVYGSAVSPWSELTEPVLPLSHAELEDWCTDAREVARFPCPPWRVAALCRRMADADPTGRWVFGMAKRTQELLVLSTPGITQCRILRLAEPVGAGQSGLVSQLARDGLRGRSLEVDDDTPQCFVDVDDIGRLLLDDNQVGFMNVGGPTLSHRELASHVAELCDSASAQSVAMRTQPGVGLLDTSLLETSTFQLTPLSEVLWHIVAEARSKNEPLFDPPLPVVLPPRLARPDEVADRQQQALWTGQLKHGNRWSRQLRDDLHARLGLGPDDELLLTTSGTEALRLALVGVVGPARAGDIALLPSFTYPVTAHVLTQLGYRLRYVDVDRDTWTLDPQALAQALAMQPASVVVCVDTFGNACDYDRLLVVCSQHGVPLVADSAASLGSCYHGRPVGSQAAAHAFSMSFAKVLSAGGAGGAVALRHGHSHPVDLGGWLGSNLMDELHAVAALDQLPLLDELIERRRCIAALYEREIESLSSISAQRVTPASRHSYVHWVMRTPQRARMARELARLGVQTRDYFRALHLRDDPVTWNHLSITEQLDGETLALPMSSELTGHHARRVLEALERAYMACSD